VAIGPDGNIWITQHGGNKLTTFNPVNRTFNDYPTQDSQSYPFGVAISGKRIWFVEHIGNAIASFNLETKSFDSFPIPSTSSDVQLLTVDQNGNVWFTLPAANSFGVLSPIASSLQIESTSPPDQLPLLVLPAAILISSATCIVFIAGQRRMKKRASS
jgi:streptogramin lyase